MRLSESEKVEFKESTAELKQALEDICALANSGAGTLYFGISDDGKVKGQDVSDKTIRRVSTSILSSIEPRLYPDIFEQRIDDKAVLVVDVKNGSDRPYFYKGKAYKRVGTSNAWLSRYEVEKALYERDNPSYRYEKTIIKNYEGGLDSKAMDWFLEKARGERNHPVGKDDKQQDILSKLKLATRGELNLAGLLCFGEDIQNYIPQAVVKCGIFEGTTKAGGPRLGSEVYGTNIFKQIESVQDFFIKNFRKRYEVSPATWQREYEYEWPLLAIREAVANAIAHRDYTISSSISIAVFDDRVEIWSPGKLPEGITIEKLKKRHDSVLRNPAIAGMLYSTRYIEAWGTGIETMNRLLREADLPAPLYEEIGSSFVVTFMRGVQESKDVLKDTLAEYMPEFAEDVRIKCGSNAEKIFQVIRRNNFVKTIEIARKIGISQRTVDNAIARLKKAKFLKREGSPKDGYWRVLADNNSKK